MSYMTMSAPTAAIDLVTEIRDWGDDVRRKGMVKGEPKYSGGMTTYEILADVVTAAHVAGVLAAGGSLNNWPCWVKVGVDEPIAAEPALSAEPIRVSNDGLLALYATNPDGNDPDQAKATELIQTYGHENVLSRGQVLDLYETDNWRAAEE